jgi:hypothetical protein
MGTEKHEEHAENLNKVRKNLPKSPLKKARAIARKVSLVKYLNPFIDWLYGIALAAALLKDIMDLVGIGSLPGIGTVITLMATITIWAVMIITGSAFKAIKKRRLVMRYGVLVAGTLIEMVFGIDFLPIETFMVIYIFVSALEDRRDAKEKADEKAAAQSAQMQTA